MKIIKIALLILIIFSSGGWFYSQQSSNQENFIPARFGPHTYYLPNGNNNPYYHTYVCVKNEGYEPADVIIQFISNTGEVKDYGVVIGPDSMEYINTGPIVGENTVFVANIFSNQPLVVETSKYFKYSNFINGGTCTTAATDPSKTWYAAGGSTQAYDYMHFYIWNVSSKKAKVDVTYYVDDKTQRQETFQVPPNTPYKFNPFDTVGENHWYSLKADSTQPMFLWRSWYNYKDQKYPGGSTSKCISDPSKEWYFAAGSTNPDFETCIIVQNPGDETTKVDLLWQMPSGSFRDYSTQVPPESAEWISINDNIGTETDFATIVKSDQPVVAERAMYFNYKNQRPGGDIRPGVTEPSKEWYFTGGSTRTGFDTWYAIQNPGDDTAKVQIEWWYKADGITKAYSFSVAPGSFNRISANEKLGKKNLFSTRVTSNKEIVVERATHFSYTGPAMQQNDRTICWTGGHIIPGVQLGYMLYGTVTCAITGFPLNKAKVIVKGKSKNVRGVTRKTRTDKSGNYIFEDFEPGKYLAKITAQGYKKDSRKIKVPGTYKHDAQLKKK